MKNKAKCKLCGDIIESDNDKEWKQCTCGTLRLIGVRATFEKIEDICFIDDDGKEVDPTYKTQPKPTRTELLDMLDEMNARIEALPPNAAVSAITHYDFSALILLLSSIFRAD